MKNFKKIFPLFLFFSVIILSIQQVFSENLPKISNKSPEEISIDAPVTLTIRGNFGTNKGEVKNLSTNAILNVQGISVSWDGWAENEIQIYYPHFPAPGVFQVGENRLIVKTGSGQESEPFIIIGNRRGNAIITSITPTIIRADDEIVITGSGFGTNGVDGKAGTLKDSVTNLFYTQKNISWSNTQIRLKLDNLPSNFVGNTSIAVGGRLPDTRLYWSNLFPITIALPLCTNDSWTCTNWSSCSENNSQSRVCNKNFNCEGGTTSPTVEQKCEYKQAICNALTYSDWSACSINGERTRVIISSSPTGCAGGNPVLTQSCTLPKTPTKPIETKTPDCDEDTWTCGDWGMCSVDGVQKRSCKRTFDCPSVEDPSPTTSQSCQTIKQKFLPEKNTDTSEYNEVDKDQIIKATVKLICMINFKTGKQGSGTVIDPKGIILTNKHVVEGTKGCAVGFTENADDDPLFSEVADIIKKSNDEDIALIKIRNNQNANFEFIDISNGSVSSKNLGNKVMIFGYPGIGGSKLTYSDGALSGFGSKQEGQGNYLKTTAVIEHGNSGGGAYLVDTGTFLGIPSAGIKGELNAIGYILSITKIKNWINGSGLAYSESGFSNLSNKLINASSSIDISQINDIQIVDASTAKVSIYSDNSKKTLLSNEPGTIQKHNQPKFQITNANEAVGFYIYFGTNIMSDPVKKGRYYKKSEFTPFVIKKPAIYYLLFKIKDKNGNVSDPVIIEYRYKK